MVQQRSNPCVNIVQNVCNLTIHTFYTCFTVRLRPTLQGTALATAKVACCFNFKQQEEATLSEELVALCLSACGQDMQWMCVLQRNEAACYFRSCRCSTLQQWSNPRVNVFLNVCNLTLHTFYTCFTPRLGPTVKQSMC